MTWYRTDKLTGQIATVTEARVLQVLEGNYEAPKLVISQHKANGLPIQSPFAVYEWRTP